MGIKRRVVEAAARLHRRYRRGLEVAAPLPEDRPAERRTTGHDGGTYDLVVYQTERLTDENGRWPEHVAASVLANAFDHAGVDAAIRYGFDPLPAPLEDPYGDDSRVLAWFGEEASRPAAGDANVLLTFADGGVTGGSNSVAGAKALVPLSAPRSIGTGQEAATQYTIVHEVGHALGVPGDASPGDEVTTLGRTWVENGYWHRTAVVSTEEGGENACGEPLAAHRGEPTVWRQHYSECAVERFDRPGG